jgi:cell division protein FtsN
MARDYRRGGVARAAPRRKETKSCVWSFILGAMIGAFAVGFYWIQTSEPPEQITTVEPAKPPPSPSRPLDWQFDDLLRDTEVDVRAGPTPPPPAARPQAANAENAAEVPPGSAVVVQVASFTRGADAERLRAEIALLGISSRVEVTTSNGVTYHRVRSGPYSDPAELNLVVDLLKRNGKEAVPYKLN